MICLLMNPRSGSSMTTQIFAAHGLRVDGDRKYEHQGIKNWIKKHYPIDWHQETLFHTQYEKQFHDYLNTLEIDCFKGMILWWSIIENYPGIIPIGIKRKTESVVQSLVDVNPVLRASHREETRHVIDVRYRLLDEIIERENSVMVYTDELIAGNYNSIEKAFDHCGLTFDSTIADRVIDPRKWHNK